MQSHLTTSNHRLRAATASTASPAPRSRHPAPSPPGQNGVVLLFRSLLQIEDHSSWMKPALMYSLSIYCLVSVVFSTATLYSRSFANPFRPHQAAVQLPEPPGTTSPLETLLTSQRSARLASYLSNGIEPFVIFNSAVSSTASACMWILDNEKDIRAFVDWSPNWSGPISLVIATATLPASDEHLHLLSRLDTLRQPRFNQLSVHLVHTTNAQHHSPAQYLNIARLFASTPHVVLFPGHPKQHTLPPNSFNSLVPYADNDHKPMLVSAAPVSPHNPSLVPLMLPRNADIWCNERLSFVSSRTADWSECVWQVWLEEYGLERVNITMSSREDSSPSRLYERLSARYQTEVCDSTAKLGQELLSSD
uniref:Glycosyltransferase family 8 protein n=1 Tax=Mycena chlorophos TaxID=658473 RepID=A0ABQ0M0E7_MYCCL|nr:predicted protein [Mycena chlorophos]